jgi:hypothetical protein
MFQLATEDRLRSWREFRATLDTLPLEEALVQTAEHWVSASFVPYNLDPEQPATWPDPWSLIDENIYCDLAKCLGIVYTMALTGHRTALDIEIRIYQDTKTGYEYNLAWFNQGIYILNLIDGEIVNNEQFDKTLKLKRTFTAVELQLENY